MESDGISPQPLSEGDSTPVDANGAALLLVIGEPASEDHKTLILGEISKGFRCWQHDAVDINDELAHLANKADIGEEGPNGERILQNRSNGLAVEILVNPQLQTLQQAVKKFMSVHSTYKHLIYAGHSFSGNGAWVLQDDTFTLSHLAQVFKDNTVEEAIKAQKGSQLVVHCHTEGEWKQTNLQKMTGLKDLNVQLNPSEKVSNSHGVLQFAAYISNFVKPMTMTDLLKTTDYVGNLRFSKPTLYIFPGCEGDSALFVISGFNLLVNGGYRRKACFWDFSRHLDRIDAVLLTHLGSDNLFGVSSMLYRKSLGNVHPEIGYIYMNTADKLPQVNGDKKPSLAINLAEEGSKIVEMTKQIGQTPHPCLRPTTGNQLQPINLYHKVGHGSLDMYVLNPVSDSKELKEFYQQWNKQVAEFGVAQSISLPSMLSICALLVWQPADPNEKINRIFFPGNAPQHKIAEGMEKLKHLDFLKHPACSAKDLQSKGATKKAGPARPASGRTVKSSTEVSSSVKKTESTKVTTERREPQRPRSEVSKSADPTKGKNGPSKLSEPKSKATPPRSTAPKTNKSSKEEDNKKASKMEEKPKAKPSSPTKSSPRKPADSASKKPATETSPKKAPQEKEKPLPEADLVKMVEAAPKPVDTKPEEVPAQVEPPPVPQESLIDITPEAPPAQAPAEPASEKTPSPEPLPDPNQYDAAPAQSQDLSSMQDPFMMEPKQDEPALQQPALDDILLPNGGQQANEVEELEEDHDEQELVQPESLPEPVAYTPQEPDLIPDSFPSKDIPDYPVQIPSEGLILPEPDVVPSPKNEAESPVALDMPVEKPMEPFKEDALEREPEREQVREESPDQADAEEAEAEKDEADVTDISEQHRMQESLTEELDTKSTEDLVSAEDIPSPEVMEGKLPVHEEQHVEEREPQYMREDYGQFEQEREAVHEQIETHEDKVEQDQGMYEEEKAVNEEGEVESGIERDDNSPCTEEDITEDVSGDEERMMDQQEAAQMDLLKGDRDEATPEDAESPQIDEPVPVHEQMVEPTPEHEIEERAEPPSQQETISPVPSPVEPVTKIDALDVHHDEEEGEISPDEADSQGDAGEISPDFDSQGSQEGSPVMEQPPEAEDISPYAFENKGFTGISHEEVVGGAESEMSQSMTHDTHGDMEAPEDACVDASEKDAAGYKEESHIPGTVPTINSPDAAAAGGVDPLAESYDEQVKSKEETEERDEDHLEMSNIPEAFEKDITPDPLDQAAADEEDSTREISPSNEYPSDEGISQDMSGEHGHPTEGMMEEEIPPSDELHSNHGLGEEMPEHYDHKESEEGRDAVDIKQSEGLNPFDGLDQAQIANAQDPIFSPGSDNVQSQHQGWGADKEVTNQMQDPFGLGIESQDPFAAAAGNTAPSQQAYRDPFDEFAPDDGDREMAQQEFDPESQWGKPMGLPSPPPPEEKSAASNGPVKGNKVPNGKGVANGKTSPTKSASKPGDGKRPDSATVTKTKASDKSTMQKTHSSKTVTEKKKVGATEKLNTSRSETSRTEKHNTSKVETTKTTTGKGRPSSAAASEPKAKAPSKRPATATGSSRSSPAPAKMPPMPPMTPFYMDLTYIPHHGNTAFCDVEFFKRIRARYYVYSSLSPNPQTLNALLDGKEAWDDKDLKVTIIPTYDNDTLHHWMALNKDRLNELKVDVDPSASRCTVQLQDHETCCLAYRLEFSNTETL